MQKFLDHLRDSSPGFCCYRQGSSGSKLEHEIRVHHQLGAPASRESIAELRSKLGQESGQFEALYSLHNGMELYEAGTTVGIQFFEIEELEERNAEWQLWFEDMDEDEICEFQKHGIAFGEIVCSGNYFVFWKGKIYYSDHDGGDDEPHGNTFSEFLDRIAENPAKFLYDAGCYTRYGPEQWIPGEYVPDMR